MSTTKLPAHARPGRWTRAVRAVRRTPRAVVGLALVGFAAVAVLLVLGLFDREQVVESQQAEQEAEATLTSIADPLAALCTSDATVRARLGDDVCFTAQQVVAMPPARPIPGAEGDPGTDGRGIVATVIRADGHLVVSYTDGARIDVGPVVGEAGVAGRGIVGSQIADGRLVLRFTDDTTQDLGPVVGARGEDGDDGRGITSTAIVAGRLIVTYSDATTEDAGPVPPGPPGANAELPAQVVRTYPDGTTETCVRNGGTEDAPVYDCSERV